VTMWWEGLVSFVILMHGLGHLVGIGTTFSKAGVYADWLGIFSP
jgi:hypothetical protein